MARPPVLSDTGVRIEERRRAHAILTSPEGLRNPKLAHELILQGNSVASAIGILKMAPADNPYVAALGREAIGIEGPSGNALQPADPRAARLEQIKSAAETFNTMRGY